MKGQNGCIIAAKSGGYLIKHRMPDGRQKKHGIRPQEPYTTYEAAQAALHEILTDVNTGNYIEPRSITFPQFAEEWIAKRISIKGSTEAAYASIIRQHLIPNLNKRLQEIQYSHVTELITKLESAMDPKTLRNVIGLLHTMLVGKRRVL